MRDASGPARHKDLAELGTPQPLVPIQNLNPDVLMISERGLPGVIVSDNGCELTSTAVLRWSIGRLGWHYIAASQCRTPSWDRSIAACPTIVSTSM